MRENSGFTLIELIVVIALLSITAAAFAPRLLERGALWDRAVAEEIRSQLRLAQHLALATGCPVQVRFEGAHSYQAWQDSNCLNSIVAPPNYTHPAGEAVPLTGVSALTVAGFPLTYSRLGEPADSVVSIYCDRPLQVARIVVGEHCISIERLTGRVR